MGEVIRAFDRNLHREMALKRPKVLEPTKDKDALENEYRARLLVEAQVTAQLDHPNIVPVHELGVGEDGRLFFTMKLVRGKRLTDMLDELRPEGSVPNRALKQDELRPLIQIVLKVCDALACAHSEGVIHRDLKPDNIMVGAYGAVYLMDWGIAKLREPAMPRGRYRIEEPAGTSYGTPSYLSPEQARGYNDQIDERTDVFGVGAILYEIVTGVPPYTQTDEEKALAVARARAILPPEQFVPTVHPRLARIVERATALDPDLRYQTVIDLQKDLDSFLRCGWQFERRKCAAGDSIVAQGEAADEAFIIAQGRCEAFTFVAGQRTVLRTMVDGDVFGETGMLGDMPRTASVVAVDPTEVLVLHREELTRDNEYGHWASVLVQTLARRFAERDAEAAILKQNRNAYGTVVGHLCEHGRREADGRWVAPWSDLWSKLASEIVPVSGADGYPFDSGDDRTVDLLAAWAGKALERAGAERKVGPIRVDLAADCVWIAPGEEW
jgi:serine/threonine-protein kinase